MKYTLTECQLTSLHSLQSSLDILRAHRPAYTPRTGFVWPIMDAISTDRKKIDDDDDAPPEEEPQAKRPKIAPYGTTKKQQNSMLLFNAMRTTTVHANMSFSLPASSESIVTDTPAAGTGSRSSVTPAPVPRTTATPKPTAVLPATQDALPTKGPPGGGKKKRKRESS